MNTTVNNKFSITPKNDVRDRVKVEIGDTKQPDTFYPQAKVMRWDNEVNFSARLIHEELNPAVSLNGDIVRWAGEKLEAHFYDLKPKEGLDEGGFEIEIILKEKPKTNKLQFSIVDKGLQYFYQPPELTPEEIADGALPGCRPENVKGSYAVYCLEPKKNYEGGKIYKIGKVGHIYRPKIIDSAGKEVWGVLDITDNILTVSIPQDFLEKATYPVYHAAGLTFGYATTPVSGYAAITDCRAIINTTVHTAGPGETVTQMAICGFVSSGTTGYDTAIYTMSGGLPNTRAVTPATCILPSSKGWGTVNVSWPLTNGTTYCCAYGNDGAGTENIYYDNASGNNRSNDTNTGAMPATWTHSSYGTAIAGIYATYDIAPPGGLGWQIAIGGTWKTITDASVCIDGAWRGINDLQLCIWGAWKNDAT